MTQYTKEFREQAILLSDEIGVKKAAEQLGVVYSTLVDWRKRRSTMRKEKQNVSQEPLTEREKQLMKEIAELKEANEILKDAMSFFVKDRRKKPKENLNISFSLSKRILKVSLRKIIQ